MTNEGRAELSLLKLCLARRNCNKIEMTNEAKAELSLLKLCLARRNCNEIKIRTC